MHVAWAQDLVELMRSIETEAKYCRAGLDVCSVAVLHTMAAMLAEVTWVEAGLVVILQARQPCLFPTTNIPLPYRNPIRPSPFSISNCADNNNKKSSGTLIPPLSTVTHNTLTPPQAVVNDSLSPAISLEDVRTTVRQLQTIIANNLNTTVVTYPVCEYPP